MIDWYSAGTYVLELLCRTAVSLAVVLGVFGCFLVPALLLQLVTLSLRRKWYDLLGEKSWILLAAPGTVIHETGHALFCLIFGHKILEMKLFSPGEDGTLGMVDHSWDSKSLYQRAGNFFIGTGPIIAGVAVIICCTAWLLPDVWEELTPPEFYTFSDLAAGVIALICRMFRVLCDPEIWHRWQSWGWLLVTLLTGSHITLSKADLKNAATGFWIVLLALVPAALILNFFQNPAELLFKYGSAHIACVLAIMIFILLVLLIFTLFLHLPVFQAVSGGKKNTGKNAGK